jgi:asparagine synthase (glutamine-hydrolysing)
MCGFFCNFTDSPLSIKSRTNIATLLRQRGPDNLGQVSGQNYELLHARLSIIDLSPDSNQPFYSSCGNYIIVFNGEIYNYREIKNDLIDKNIKFKTNSDTEVILQGYIEYKEEILYKLRGMFSFVIYDIKRSYIFSARDPYGIKPLYYSISNNGLIIGSQVRYFKKSNLLDMELSPNGIFGFYYMGNVPEPYTWYKHIYALESGSYMTYSDGILTKVKYSNINDYWSVGDDNNFNYNHYKNVITDTVKSHTLSDVPISIFLSSGIDSIALGSMIRESGYSNDVYAITLTTDEYNNTINDESTLAIKLSHELGFTHIRHNVTKDKFMSLKNEFFNDMDQPSMDGLNNWMASKVAKEHNIKVALSGVGGDELFSGYDTFSRVPKTVNALKLINKIPQSYLIKKIITHFIAKKINNTRVLDFNSYGVSNYEIYLIRRSITSITAAISFAEKMVDMSNFDIQEFIDEIIGKYSYDSSVGLLESVLYMKNQLLKDADWAGSAHGVEIRTPFVDYSLLNNIGEIINNSTDKSFLLSCVHYKLQNDLTNRAKTGFDIPIKKWINNNHTFDKIDLGWNNWMQQVCKNYVEN